MAKKTLLVIGLGNPGEKYAHTRHNAGFEVISRLEESFSVKLRRKFLLQGQTAEITDGETKIVLCEPLTYMNKRGAISRGFHELVENGNQMDKGYAAKRKSRG